MKFLKLLGRGTLYHLFSPPSLFLDLAPVSAPQLLSRRLEESICYTEPFIQNVCFEGTLHLH